MNSGASATTERTPEAQRNPAGAAPERPRLSAVEPGTGNTRSVGTVLEPLLKQLRGNTLIPLILVGAAITAIAVSLFMWAGKPEYRVLYSNLSEADGGRIINELDQRGIPYQFSSGGGALLVPGDQVHTLRLRLAEQGLPQGGNAGFEIMDNQAFGVSQFTERVNFQRALEGELSESIQSLGPVNQARVHLAMARPSVFVREQQPAKASVVLSLHPGRALGEGQVNAVVHMVSSSVPELAAEDVTVVDQGGRLLSDTEGELSGSQLEYTEQVENSYRRRIEDILAPILGSGNVRAQVAAQMDFSMREETAERYTPNRGADTAAVRSAQSHTSYDSAGESASGVPGALSNTPPSSENTEGEEPAEENSRNGRMRREETINYELDRNLVHIERPRGQVERLSVAVVVNHRDSLDENGEPTREPLSDEELTRIEQLVRQAIGFTEERGDRVTVVNSPFAQSTEQAVAEQPWWQSAGMWRLADSLIRYLIVGLVAIFLYRRILRPMLARHREAAPPPAVARQVSELAETPAANEEAPAAPSGERKRRRSPAHEKSLKEVHEMAEEDPQLVAMIVRGWMGKYD